MNSHAIVSNSHNVSSLLDKRQNSQLNDVSEKNQLQIITFFYDNNHHILTKISKNHSFSKNDVENLFQKDDQILIFLNYIVDSNIKNNESINDFEDYASSFDDSFDEVKMSSRLTKTNVSDFCLAL